MIASFFRLACILMFVSAALANPDVPGPIDTMQGWIDYLEEDTICNPEKDEYSVGLQASMLYRRTMDHRFDQVEKQWRSYGCDQTATGLFLYKYPDAQTAGEAEKLARRNIYGRTLQPSFSSPERIYLTGNFLVVVSAREWTAMDERMVAYTGVHKEDRFFRNMGSNFACEENNEERFCRLYQNFLEGHLPVFPQGRSLITGPGHQFPERPPGGQAQILAIENQGGALSAELVSTGVGSLAVIDYWNSMSAGTANNAHPVHGRVQKLSGKKLNKAGYQDHSVTFQYRERGLQRQVYIRQNGLNYLVLNRLRDIASPTGYRYTIAEMPINQLQPVD